MKLLLGVSQSRLCRRIIGVGGEMLVRLVEFHLSMIHVLGMSGSKSSVSIVYCDM